MDVKQEQFADGSSLVTIALKPDEGVHVRRFKRPSLTEAKFREFRELYDKPIINPNDNAR